MTEKLESALGHIQAALATISEEANARAFRPGVNQSRLREAEEFLRNAAVIVQGEKNTASYDERREQRR